MLREPETWVLVAFLLFVALMVYLKVPARIAAMLDSRANKISAELAEARKLREEAQALLESFQKKRAAAEQEAEAIIAAAKREAEAYAQEQRVKLTETIARRQKQAEQKIAQAEAAAIKDVRASATDLAVAAAAELAAAASKGTKGAGLIDESIAVVRAKLN